MSDNWRCFFQELSSFLVESQGRIGICRSSYCEYAIDRMELAVNSCTSIVNFFRENTDVDAAVLAEYVEELVVLLNTLLEQWKQYSLVLETTVDRLEYRSPFAPPTGRQGRPRFDMNREQLEYLLSLSFNWSEISNLLAISRMTLYR